MSYHVTCNGKAVKSNGFKSTEACRNEIARMAQMMGGMTLADALAAIRDAFGLCFSNRDGEIVRLGILVRC